LFAVSYKTSNFTSTVVTSYMVEIRASVVVLAFLKMTSLSC